MKVNWFAQCNGCGALFSEDFIAKKLFTASPIAVAVICSRCAKDAVLVAELEQKFSALAI